MRILEQISRIAGNYFAVWVILASILAYFVQSLGVLVNYVNLLLGIVMFGMGLTLTGSDFARVFQRPKDVILGVVAQFTVMPLLGLLLAFALRLPPEIAVGVILVGSVPGGTASNVMTYLAKGDVPLSVSMTAVSTIFAPLVTPGLMLLLAGSWLPVDAWGLFKSIVQVVLIPVILGVLINTLFGKTVQKASSVMPLISVVAIILIVMGVVAKNAPNLLTVGPLVFLAVVLHNLCGYMLGYAVGKVLKVKAAQKRAISIEVGMQNSGLAAGLASAHFGGLAALPGAIFSVWHNISGPLLATYWSRKRVDEDVTVRQ